MSKAQRDSPPDFPKAWHHPTNLKTLSSPHAFSHASVRCSLYSERGFTSTSLHFACFSPSSEISDHSCLVFGEEMQQLPKYVTSVATNLDRTRKKNAEPRKK